MLKRTLLIAACAAPVIAMSGCSVFSSDSKKPTGPYVCEYVNTQTKRVYKGVGKKQNIAQQRAQYFCEQGPFRWECKLKGCKS